MFKFIDTTNQSRYRFNNHLLQTRFTPRSTPRSTPISTPRVTPRSTPRVTPRSTPRTSPRTSHRTSHRTRHQVVPVLNLTQLVNDHDLQINELRLKNERIKQDEQIKQHFEQNNQQESIQLIINEKEQELELELELDQEQEKERLDKLKQEQERLDKIEKERLDKIEMDSRNPFSVFYN